MTKFTRTYPTDLQYSEWSIITQFFPTPKRGRPRKWERWLRIGHDSGFMRREKDPELDILTDDFGQNFFKMPYHIAQTDGLGINDLLSAEGQEALGQARGPLGGREYLFDVTMGRMIEHFHKQEIAVADDGGQDIIEIVRHAACKEPHRLHFLGLEKLGLKGFLFRYVAKNGVRHQKDTVLVVDRLGPH